MGVCVAAVNAADTDIDLGQLQTGDHLAKLKLETQWPTPNVARWGGVSHGEVEGKKGDEV